MERCRLCLFGQLIERSKHAVMQRRPSGRLRRCGGERGGRRSVEVSSTLLNSLPSVTLTSASSIHEKPEMYADVR